MRNRVFQTAVLVALVSSPQAFARHEILHASTDHDFVGSCEWGGVHAEVTATTINGKPIYHTKLTGLTSILGSMNVIYEGGGSFSGGDLGGVYLMRRSDTQDYVAKVNAGVLPTFYMTCHFDHAPADFRDQVLSQLPVLNPIHDQAITQRRGDQDIKPDPAPAGGVYDESQGLCLAAPLSSSAKPE